MSFATIAATIPTGAFERAPKLKRTPLNPTFAQCSYCSKLPDLDQKESNCRGCGALLKARYFRSESDIPSPEPYQPSRSNDDPDPTQPFRNLMMGDITSSGIPGGLDMDFTTPL